METIIAETRNVADGNGITVWFGLPNYAVDPKKPTATELNSALDITEAISWENWGFGAQASNQNSDPSLIDVGNTQTRGYANFGGTISFFYPKDYTNTSNIELQAFLALEDPKTLGYIIIRSDGQKTTSSAPDQHKAAVANDFVYIYKVISSGWNDVVTGENNFKYTITFVNQSDLWTNAMVASSVTVTTPAAIGTPDYVVGGITALGVYRTGRQLAAVTNIVNGYPGWFNWTSSDPSVATVDANGVVTAVSAGTADIVATDKVHGVSSSPLTVTITAS